MTSVGSPGSSPRRREASRLAILDAALALCREEGYARLSIEGIASRAGVGKQTIYRWWPSKGAVLLDALDREASTAAAFPDTGDVRADMLTTLTDIARFHADPNLGPLLAALIAEAQQDAQLGPRIVESFFTPRRAPILARLHTAQEVGQLPETLDLDALLEVIFGALFHRLLLPGPVPDTAYVTFIVDVIFAGGATTTSELPWPGRPAPRAC
jgi:AcrR family transcriptional regulator